MQYVIFSNDVYSPPEHVWLISCSFICGTPDNNEQWRSLSFWLGITAEEV
jgi:hypothetical protein